MIFHENSLSPFIFPWFPSAFQCPKDFPTTSRHDHPVWLASSLQRMTQGSHVFNTCHAIRCGSRTWNHKSLGYMLILYRYIYIVLYYIYMYINYLCIGSFAWFYFSMDLYMFIIVYLHMSCLDNPIIIYIAHLSTASPNRPTFSSVASWTHVGSSSIWMVFACQTLWVQIRALESWNWMIGTLWWTNIAMENGYL
jgi:hypothetical protein